ncbi:MAG: endopeptidase La [Alphaproteobacteria bacterium]|jgi:ATP-dependent Lon protease|nr:endopeptidase La [Alphaproteobacteria bacterium]MBT5390465.1 endopeptidase La [Alphaproteobacteria bacterium]MBT5540674.1 endopeptidase La [Alphaproteobacteria bacterium]MBT5654657.1 endopeptidase La [Alphaproteobacteria bacterium]
MDKESKLQKGTLFPVLPLRDIVVFPDMVVPLFVGREKSVQALEYVMQRDVPLLLVTQKTSSQENPKPEDLYSVGTLGTVLQLLKLPDGTVKVLVEGGSRAKLINFKTDEKFYQAYADPIIDGSSDTEEVKALRRAIIDEFEKYIKTNQKISPEVFGAISQMESAAKLADAVASYLTLKIQDKQKLLEIESLTERLEKVYSLMGAEIESLNVERKIRNRVKRQMEKSQREYFLNEQIKAIQNELGDAPDGKGEIEELEEKINKTKLSKEAKDKALAELKKLKNMSPMSGEATVVRNYLDWLLDIPWQKRKTVKKDIKSAEKILEKDHFGLEKVKERILEYLAVQQRVDKVQGQILCLVGPPGVGKTSLGKSIARATGRKFVRVSLGGVRDEAEIRGHRRTYIGAMPGKIIQGMKKAKASNPLFLLDEVDKLGADWRGDPASALLEVLDPEQNTQFNDHYLEVDYDLSDVMFVTTANTLNMPQPLLDRMETIRISGYTEDEKLGICTRHLIPKQLEKHGLKKGEWSISAESLKELIRYYTREAGVRNLERETASLMRKAVKDILMNGSKKISITPKVLQKYLGPHQYRYGEMEDKDAVGVTTGLAWTEVGGELLTIEAVLLPGKGKMRITGKLGEVMQESVQAAASYVRSRAQKFGIDPKTFEETDIHIHVPEGATPKDGPSAGVAMCTSIVSLLTGIPVRRDLAMTGEITLRGRVLAIGGLKEKVLAAHRGGIKTVLIPKDNEKDLVDIPEKVRKEVKIIAFEDVDKVLDTALSKKITPFKESNLGRNMSKKGQIAEVERA